MKLFSMVDWKITISEEAYMLQPFKVILDNDKSKTKELAMKELAFVWFYTDIKSDYTYLINDKEKEVELIKDLKLPNTWKINENIRNAIEFYKLRTQTVSSVILQNSLFIANTLSNKMRTAVESDEDLLTFKEIETIAKGLTQMPNIVKSLQQLEQTVIKEVNEKMDKVGSQDKALFEDGFGV